MEDRVVFVCDNSHILTFAIFLFVNVLTRPFMYAFPSVYIIPKEDFLNAPFPFVYGLLKKKKWIEQNQILDRFKNTYVFLTPMGVYVSYTESRKEMLKGRPEKLKGILAPLFKDLEKRRRLTTVKTGSSRT